LHVIQESKSLPTLAAVLSLDAEKAFDRFEWNYLWQVMERLDLGCKFIDMVCILYANTKAMVSTHGLHSEIFSMEHGSQQGCPLSPMLFAISLEPLAQVITHNQICSVQFKATNSAISLFADDILLYFSDL